MINVGVLLLAYIAVSLAPGAKVVRLGPVGQCAVVRRVLAIAQIESFTENDVTGRGPVSARDTVVKGVTSPSAALMGAAAAAVVVETAPATAVLETSAAPVETAAETAPASVAAAAAAALAALFLLVVGLCRG